MMILYLGVSISMVQTEHIENTQNIWTESQTNSIVKQQFTPQLFIWALSINNKQ